MLERFRLLRAALRLEEFTIAELARDSGVAPGTVQKFMRRRADLFVSEEGPATGRPGGRPQINRLNAEAARAELRAAADAIELPAEPETPHGDPFALHLAEHALLRVFPRAGFPERQDVLAAAAAQFDGALEARPERRAELGDLLAGLTTLVEIQAWLIHSAERLGDAPGFQDIVAVIEAVISAGERDERTADPKRFRRTVETLAAMPARAAALAEHAEQAGVEPPRLTWWADLQATAWATLRVPAWADIAGDLGRPEHFRDSGGDAAAAPCEPAMAADRSGCSLVGNSGDGLVLPFFDTNPDVFALGRPWRDDLFGDEIMSIIHDHDRDSAAYEADLLHFISVGEDFADRNSVRLSFPAQPLAVLDPASKRKTGVIGSFDVDLTEGAIGMANLVLDGDQPSHVSTAFSALHAARGRYVYATNLVLGRSATPWTHPPRPTAVERKGLCLWSGTNIIQVRLDPGQTIKVFGGERDFLHPRAATHDRELGDVFWFDFDAVTGRLFSAYMQQRASGALIPVPFNDLNYDAHRQCFILRGRPRPWAGASPAGRAGAYVGGNAPRH